MSFFKSSNPALRSGVFTSAALEYPAADRVMTIDGTVNKIVIMTFLVFGGALTSWYLFATSEDPSAVMPFMIGGFVIGFITALIIIFKKTAAQYLAPVYALAQGFALGVLSAFMELVYPGIVLQAIFLTFGILFSLLFLYKTGIIKVTERYKTMVAAATMGIAVFYLISFVGGFFGMSIPMVHEASTVGIIFSLFVVVIASLNLTLDFQFISEGSQARAPKYMEWYAAFGLMVTLIWLYIEILRLLSKLRER